MHCCVCCSSNTCVHLSFNCSIHMYEHELQYSTTVLRSVVTDINTVMADLQVQDSVEQIASSMCHIYMGDSRSYNMNFKLRIICEAKQTNNTQAAKNFVFLNVMYDASVKTKKSLRVPVHQEKHSEGLIKADKFIDLYTCLLYTSRCV